MRSSSAESKRAFLQKKGLTAAEIDEAFKRVPAEEPPSPPAYDPQAAVPSPPQPIAGPQPLKVDPEPWRWSQVLAPLRRPLPFRLVTPLPSTPQVVLGAASATTLVYVAKNLLEPYRYRILHALSRAVAPREDKEAEMRKEQPAASAELQKCVQALETSTTRICSAVEGLTAKLDSPARQGEAQQRMEAVLRDLQGAIKSLPSVVQK